MLDKPSRIQSEAMKNLVADINQEQLLRWTPKTRSRVNRSGQSTASTEKYVSAEITRHIENYSALTHEQERRLARDNIDFLLRRFHQYVIQQGMGAHYIKHSSESSILEHLIPASVLRDLLLDGVFTLPHALYAPTVLLPKSDDKLLRQSGRVSTTDCVFHPFRRYVAAGITGTFSTFRGHPVPDLHEWSLREHYALVLG